MNTGLIDFYSTMFNIQITLIFIIFPILFVFIQLTGKEHTTYLTQKIMSDIKIKICGFASLIIIIITGFSYYLLSLEKHDFIKSYYLNVEQYITSNLFSLSVLIIFITNLIFILSFVLQRIRETNPKFFIESYILKIKPEALKLYFYKNYGLPYLSRPFRFEITGLRFGKATKEDQERHEKAYKKSMKQYKKLKKKNRRIQSDIDQKYEPVLEVVINTLNYNLTNIHISDFHNTFESFIDSFFNLKTKLNDEEGLIDKLVKDYSKNLTFLFDSALNINYKPFTTTILSGNRSLLDVLIKQKNYQYCSILFDSFENYVDALSNKNEEEIDTLFKIFHDYGTKLIKHDSSEQKTTEAMLVNFSRCAEKTISKFDIIEQPVMMGIDNKYAYDYIFECLYQFFEYQKKYKAASYPLLLFDANYCVFNALVKKYKSSKNKFFKDYFSEHQYTFFSDSRKLFIENYKNENERSACLCTMKVCELYDILAKNELNDILKTNIEILIYIGFFIFSKDKDISCDFMFDGLRKYIFERLSRYKPNVGNIDDIVFELHIKSISREEIDMKKAEPFLMDLAYLFESNFRLKIDWKNKKWEYETN